MWQIVANLEFVTGFAIDLQTRKPNISPRDHYQFHSCQFDNLKVLMFLQAKCALLKIP